jgi:hypothetical protein
MIFIVATNFIHEPNRQLFATTFSHVSDSRQKLGFGKGGFVLRCRGVELRVGLSVVEVEFVRRYLESLINDDDDETIADEVSYFF